MTQSATSVQIVSANQLPPLATVDYDALEADIAKRGVLVPILVNSATGEILDGHNRWEIATRIGKECPVREIEFADQDEAEVVSIALNAKRRRLSLEQRQEIALRLRAKGWTQAAIGDALGVARQTVGEWFGEIITKAESGVGYIPPTGKLTREQKESIFERHLQGETQVQIAADFGVSQPAIHKTVAAVAKRLERERIIAEQAAAIAAGEVAAGAGTYDVLVLDPPWAYGTPYDPDGRRVANPYPEMTQQQLLALQLPASDDCVMWLWTTHRFIWDAKALLDAWGFEYRAILVWDKEKMGMGSSLRMQCEFCLLATKGAPTFHSKGERDIVREARREHSRKPDAFYSVVDSFCRGRKLDYFSREPRPGWDQGGNDTGKFAS